MGDKAEAEHMRRRFFKAGLKGEERIGGASLGSRGQEKSCPSLRPPCLPSASAGRVRNPPRGCLPRLWGQEGHKASSLPSCSHPLSESLSGTLCPACILATGTTCFNYH